MSFHGERLAALGEKPLDVKTNEGRRVRIRSFASPYGLADPWSFSRSLELILEDSLARLREERLRKGGAVIVKGGYKRTYLRG